MSWAAVTMRWPAQATQWLEGLDVAKGLASAELVSTALRLGDLDGLATTAPGPVAGAAQAAIATGRAAMAEQLGQAPACLVVTPFQRGVEGGVGETASAVCSSCHSSPYRSTNKVGKPLK